MIEPPLETQVEGRSSSRTPAVGIKHPYQPPLPYYRPRKYMHDCSRPREGRALRDFIAVAKWVDDYHVVSYSGSAAQFPKKPPRPRLSAEARLWAPTTHHLDDRRRRDVFRGRMTRRLDPRKWGRVAYSSLHPHPFVLSSRVSVSNTAGNSRIKILYFRDKTK